MQTNDVHSDNFSYMFINLVGEIGEFASKVAKHIRKNETSINDNKLSPLVNLDKSELELNSDLLELKKDLGDVLWLLTGLCKVMGWSLEDVAKTNLEKIADSVKGGSN